MIRRRFRRCGHAPGTLSSEDQRIVDAFRTMLAALRDPEPWTPGRCEDIAVRVDPFVERAHTRPGDGHGHIIEASKILGIWTRPTRRSPTPRQA
ncbi:hypothetical protein ABT300_31075 [Streptomyces sp. NPDC001027]|uniref:hypothetical protein n=1 Tax=Streptomyces sp. NPDC001027 TaxID=3154771 RepID=UPI00331DDA55